MYDKYSRLNTLPAAGTAVPKHKGILVSANASATVSFQFATVSGSTVAAGLTFSAGTSLLPVQVYALNTSLPAGVTAFYVN